MIKNQPISLNLTHSETPIEHLARFSARFPEYKVWLKRDDLTGIELSGNKVRKLDFLIADALKNDARRIVTCGGVQSNHCRTAAFMAVKTGLKCTLFLRGETQLIPDGNLLLDQLAGVDINYVTPETYRNIDLVMREYAEKLSAGGEITCVIPEGGSNALGAWGYISCYQEILDQARQFNLHFDAVVVATGSGGTHAGLLFGKKITNNPMEVISINVCDNPEYFKEKILRIAAEFERSFQYKLNVSDLDIKIIDGFVGSGYGQINDQVRAIIREMARSEGIVLDPVYSAKAFLGLTTLLSDGTLEYKNILFIHTGGVFGLYPFKNDLKI